MASPVRKVPTGFKSPLLRHAVSHKRQPLMVLNSRTQELNLVFRVEVEDCVFSTGVDVRGFRCGRETQNMSGGGGEWGPARG